MSLFAKGKLYHRRRDLHETYGGQQQGGISTPSKHKIVLLFTSKTGEQYGYKDGWTDDGQYLYTGEGQYGDMAFKRGNRAIRDHQADGKQLFLFMYQSPGVVECLGEMVYTGHHIRKAPDLAGNDRNAIVFELRPV